MVLPNGSKCRNNVGLAAEIFAEYGDFIHMVIFSQVKNKARIDDIFQDFFISLVRKPIPKDVKNIKGYLYKYLRNQIIETQRQAERYNAQIQKYKERFDCSIDNTEPEDALIEVEQMNNLFDLIEGRLTSSQYQAMALRYRTHHSIKEVAEKMGVKNKSVSRYISIGLKKIRQSLKLK